MDRDHVRPWAEPQSFGTTTPPSPSNRRTPKHTRQRSASYTTTFFSGAVLPSTTHAEVLSSLISSLTALSESRARSPPTGDEIDRPDTICRSYTSGSWSSPVQEDDRRPELSYSGYEDIATPPVIGFARGQPTIARKDKWAVHKAAHSQPKSMSRTKSQPSLQRPHTSSAVGHPSIERFGSTNSAASLPLRPEVRSKNSFKMFFPPRGPDDATYTQPSSRGFDTRSTRSTPGRPAHQYTKEFQVPRPLTPPELPSPLGSSRESVSGDGTPYNPLNPQVREDLNDHLIPSRRSSLRHSPGSRPSVSRQFSDDSSVLKDLNIDNELIEEDDATVRRIRELQQAREKRQSEWRRESRKSERAMRHTSLPSPNGSGKAISARSSRHSIQDTLVEAPESEQHPPLPIPSQAGNASRTPDMAKPETSLPPTPVETPSDSSRSFSPSIVQSTTSSHKKHRRGFSGSLHRSTSIRRATSDEIKSITEDVDKFLASPRFTQRIRHPRTGRTITFSEVGDPNGFVVLCCVGMGLTRYLTTFYDELAKTQKLRLITPDRPGVGESTPCSDGSNTPLAWVDDVAVICSTLRIEKFSLLAHSAGAVFALAIALKMPTYVRGRIHLLAPWIPPSQLAMAKGWNHTKAADLPTSHKLLSLLPVSFMRAANSRFLNTTGASIDTKSRKKDRVSVAIDSILLDEAASVSALDMDVFSDASTTSGTPRRDHPGSGYQNPPSSGLYSPPLSPANSPDVRHPGKRPPSSTPTEQPSSLSPQARLRLFNTTLTHKTWTLTTLNANPAVDLIICLERRKPIAFQYTDVVRAVVIHHGDKDSRIPIENVRWLSSVMKRCDLRVLEGEGHGLMANASVMSSVLAEMGKEWEDWSVIARAKEKRRLNREADKERERQREMRRGPR